MTTHDTTFSYARPATGPRPWCRAAVKALSCALAHPLVIAAPLLYAADSNWLPQHFLCCNHPEVAALAFVIAPLAAAAWGVSAAVSIRRNEHRPRPRGLLLASLAILLGCSSALLGIGLFFGLKA